MSFWSRIKRKVKSGYRKADVAAGGYLPKGLTPSEVKAQKPKESANEAYWKSPEGTRVTRELREQDKKSFKEGAVDFAKLSGKALLSTSGALPVVGAAGNVLTGSIGKLGKAGSVGGGKLTQGFMRGKTTEAAETLRISQLWDKYATQAAQFVKQGMSKTEIGKKLAAIAKQEATGAGGAVFGNTAKKAADASITQSVGRLAKQWGMSFKDADELLKGKVKVQDISAFTTLIKNFPTKKLTLALSALGIGLTIAGADTMFAWAGFDNIIGSQNIFFRTVAEDVEMGVTDPQEALENLEGRQQAREIAIAKVEASARYNPLTWTAKKLLLTGVKDQDKQIDYYLDKVRSIVASGVNPETIDEASSRRMQEGIIAIDESSRQRSEDYLADKRAYDAERDAHFTNLREQEAAKFEANRKSKLNFGLLK